jgi:hypothetical protein
MVKKTYIFFFIEDYKIRINRYAIFDKIKHQTSPSYIDLTALPPPLMLYHQENTSDKGQYDILGFQNMPEPELNPSDLDRPN